MIYTLYNNKIVLNNMMNKFWQGRIQSKISEGVQNFQGGCTFSTHKVVILQ